MEALVKLWQFSTKPNKKMFFLQHPFYKVSTHSEFAKLNENALHKAREMEKKPN